VANVTNLSPAERYAAAKNRQRYPLTARFAEQYDFPLDDFQIAGCHTLEDGKSVLVAAPTGAGKTIVGEFATFLAEHHGNKCFYTTPIKALSNQKYQDLVSVYGESEVGLLTGDSSINSGARIVVMTTEVLRNMIYADSDSIDKLGYVVMDEVHYLADKFRGAVWEEILIHLPERIQVVSLSATVSNAEEFGEWLKTVRGETEVVLSEIRPVPLYQHILIGNRILDLFVDDGRVNPEIIRLEKNSSRRVPGGSNWKESKFSSIKTLTRPEIVEKLLHRSFLPAIYFIFSRAGCDAAVASCIRDGLSLTNTEEKEEIRRIVALRTHELPHEDFGVLGFHEWTQALERGIAAHHAGLLPMFKETIEELFQRGLLKVVFATETLALGINMPARSVVLEKLVKWNGETHSTISPGEYTQLTGRAGRRGIDVEGNALILWTEQIDSGMAAGLASTRTYPLRSSFSPTYNMSANLISRFGKDKARESLGSSFAQFQADKAVVGLARQITKNQQAFDALRNDAACHLGDMNEYMTYRFTVKELEAQFSQRRHISGSRKTHHARIEEEISDVRRQAKSHPCHQCPDRESHSRLLEKAARLQKESEGLKTRMESRTNVIPRTFDRVSEVLGELGYLKENELTRKGETLTKVYAESDLLLAEILNSNLFDQLSAPDIVGVLSSLVYEGRGERSRTPRLPKSLEAVVPPIAKLWSGIVHLEESYGLQSQREPNFDLAWSAYRWATGHSLNSILRETDITVGDFVRAIRQIIDLLGQLMNAKPELHLVIREAIKRIDRGVIAYSAVVA
jgi:ATP-dependent RNA helicase HelY